MSIRIRVIIIVAVILALVYIIRLIRKKLINFKYGLGWSVVGFCVLICAIFPQILDAASLFLGIELPINMLFFLAIVLLGGIVFSLTKAVSDLTDKTKRLSQELAILRKDLYDNYDKKEDK